MKVVILVIFGDFWFLKNNWDGRIIQQTSPGRPHPPGILPASSSFQCRGAVVPWRVEVFPVGGWFPLCGSQGLTSFPRILEWVFTNGGSLESRKSVWDSRMWKFEKNGKICHHPQFFPESWILNVKTATCFSAAFRNADAHCMGRVISGCCLNCVSKHESHLQIVIEMFEHLQVVVSFFGILYKKIYLGNDPIWCAYSWNRWFNQLHPWKLTWHWKIPMFNKTCIFKWWMFYCHVSFRGG